MEAAERTDAPVLFDDLLRTIVDRLAPTAEEEPLLAPRDPLAALVAVVLTYRTAPENARAAAAALAERYPTRSALSTAPVEAIAEVIRPAGLCQQRARLIRGLIQRVLSDFPDGSLARLQEADNETMLRYLQSLPGVGAFGARWVMFTSFERSVFPIAWPVGRVMERLGLIARRGWQTSDGLLDGCGLDRQTYRQLHDALISHAQHVCLPRKPRCGSCVLTDLCHYFQHSARRTLRLTPRPPLERRPGRRPRIVEAAGPARR